MKNTMMNRILVGLTGLLIAAPGAGQAFSHSGGGGGSMSHSQGSTSHENAYGGSSSHQAGEGSSHTNAEGGARRASTARAQATPIRTAAARRAQYGQGATHTNTYGGTSTIRQATYDGRGLTTVGAYYGGTYPAYHPPATVNYYGAGCANCGGWSTAGAAAAGAAVGAAAGAAVANANNQRANSNAYSAGYAAGSANTAYAMGAIYATVPAGCASPTVNGMTYYLCGDTWFQPSHGANGVYYRVVPAP